MNLSVTGPEYAPKPVFDTGQELDLPERILKRLRKTDFMTRTIMEIFPKARHELISINTLPHPDPELRLTPGGKCHQRIGYFCLESGQPIVFTIAFISIEKTKPELIAHSESRLKPFGELLRDHYPDSSITSEVISTQENIKLPGVFLPATTRRRVYRRERYIIVDGKKIARVVEFI